MENDLNLKPTHKDKDSHITPNDLQRVRRRIIFVDDADEQAEGDNEETTIF